jgi:hypothetical protein
VTRILDLQAREFVVGFAAKIGTPSSRACSMTEACVHAMMTPWRGGNFTT